MCGRRKSLPNDGDLFPSQEIVAQVPPPQCRRKTSLVGRTVKSNGYHFVQNNIHYKSIHSKTMILFPIPKESLSYR